MLLFDIHTHNLQADHETAILDCGTAYTTGRRISMGIHPWHINGEWEKVFDSIKQYCTHANVAAIGECGIDKLHSPASIEVQKELFRAHAILAEKVKKPLIIHCVKGIEEILSVRKEIKPVQAWIIHSFRGKKEEAKQLTNAGFYLSLGEKFNSMSAASIPAGRLLVETDDSNKGISDIYYAVSTARNCTVEELQATITDNIKNIGCLL